MLFYWSTRRYSIVRTPNSVECKNKSKLTSQDLLDNYLSALLRPFFSPVMKIGFSGFLFKYFWSATYRWGFIGIILLRTLDLDIITQPNKFNVCSAIIWLAITTELFFIIDTLNFELSQHTVYNCQSVLQLHMILNNNSILKSEDLTPWQLKNKYIRYMASDSI